MLCGREHGRGFHPSIHLINKFEYLYKATATIIVCTFIWTPRRFLKTTACLPSWHRHWRNAHSDTLIVFHFLNFTSTWKVYYTRTLVRRFDEISSKNTRLIRSNTRFLTLLRRYTVDLMANFSVGKNQPGLADNLFKRLCSDSMTKITAQAEVLKFWSTSPGLNHFHLFSPKVEKTSVDMHVCVSYYSSIH